MINTLINKHIGTLTHWVNAYYNVLFLCQSVKIIHRYFKLDFFFFKFEKRDTCRIYIMVEITYLKRKNICSFFGLGETIKLMS
jgi:hypothetical protein